MTVVPKVKLPAAVLRVLPGYKLTCSVTGTPPIYVKLTWNSTVLVSGSYGGATVQLNEEGKYTCVATSRHGTDMGRVSVIFKGKDHCKR